MKIKEDESKIHTISARDIQTKVFDYFDVEEGNPIILDKITKYIEQMITNNDYESMKSLFWYPNQVSFDDIEITLISVASKIDNYLGVISINDKEPIKEIYSNYSLLLITVGKMVLKILSHTKEEDEAIQQLLNYKDYIQGLKLLREGRKILYEIYKLRGLDFFLIHYMGGETSALDDDALFNNASALVNVCNSLTLFEESKFIQNEISARKARIIEIKNEYETILENNNLQDVTKYLRVVGERFWVDYLDQEIWIGLSFNSKKDLVNSFVKEELLQKGILTGWHEVIFLLAKTIERELVKTCYIPFIDIIEQSKFTIPDNLSNKQRRRYQSRRTTFNTLKKCSVENPPTLGQMMFMINFWNDPIMDNATSMYSSIRNRMKQFIDDVDTKITKLEKNLTDNFNDTKETKILDLRNASAHPGHEDSYRWKDYIDGLKKRIGKPPKRILKLLIIDLNIEYNKVNRIGDKL